MDEFSDASERGLADSHRLLSSDEENKDVLSLPKVSTAGPQNSFLQKYSPAMKTFIPIRPFSTSSDLHPIDKAGLISTISFSWITALVWKTFWKPPTTEELWKISQYDEAQSNFERFSKIWEEEVKRQGVEKASMWRAVLRFIRTRLIISTICMFMLGMAIFVSSGIIMHQLLGYVSSGTKSLDLGLVLVGALTAVEVTRACMMTTLFAINYRSAVRTRAAVLMLVFRKVMKMSPSSGSTTVGELVTMCSNDGDRIFDANRLGNIVFLGPLIFVAGTIYTIYLLGPIGVIGSFLFILVLPLQGVLVRVMNKLRQKAIAQSEARVKKVNEILSSIKLIKMYSWEESFTKIIKEIRSKELAAIRSSAFYQSINISTAHLTPVIASVVMITAFVLLGNELTPENAFTSIAIFNAMSVGLKFMPIAVKTVADVNVSMKRLKNILVMDRIDKYVKSSTSCEANALEFTNASFCWNHILHIPDDDEIKLDEEKERSSKVESEALLQKKEDSTESSRPVLEDVNISIEKGSLMAIFGSVGSGKSSFISCILGHLRLQSGSVAVSGSVAYCAQQAWLMNATVRENIIFGLAYDEQKYEDVVTACELKQDFDIFTSGDLTEVGERGINLSGGQKQRVSLARALYSDRDIYLLDDPLSAVDIHVGRSIFNEVILKRLKKIKKTVVFVTHQLQYLSQCDRVFHVENSCIRETKEFQNEPDKKDVEVNVESTSVPNTPQDHDDLNPLSTSVPISSPSKSAASMNDLDLISKGKLMTTEERGEVVPLTTYFSYLKAAGGVIAGILMFLFFVLNIGVQQFSNFWLSYWLKQGSGGIVTEQNAALDNSTVATTDITTTYLSNVTSATFQPYVNSNDILLNPDLHFYLIVYATSAIAMFFVSVLRGYALVRMTVRASSILHQNLFSAVLQGTMEFFDSTPTGRIVNRFQKDMDELDVALPGIIEIFFFNFTMLLFAAGLIAFVFPKFLIAFAVILPVFIVTFLFFKPSAREMRRLDALTRSPWFSHISAAVTGLYTIRAYQQTKRFIITFRDLLDRNGVPCYLFACVNRWLAIRLDLMTISTCIVTTVLVILNQGIVPPAYAGLSLSSAFLMSGMLQFTVRLLTEGTARFVCIDRIKYYIENTPQEAVEFSTTPKPEWPEHGVLEFKSVNMRYRIGLPLVLKDVSFKLKPGEKIGVVGRTGAGKSSLSVALFRLVELSSGSILIDDINISTVSLRYLRSKLSSIPQDPVLFSGTVRYNLDPFGQFEDSEIWFALEQAHLKSTISKLPGQLQSMVDESGNNFSVGERQLMCLARALLRKSKIIILDEATAAVDRDTEKIVHEMIDHAFADCTIITIAHRLTSVTTCDRVIVLDDGKIAEFDSPSQLLQDDQSMFSKMISVFQLHTPLPT